MAEQSLRGAVEATSQYFSGMLELVPVKFYIEDSENASKYQFQKSKRINKLDKKLLAKKAKLLKLDPATHKSIEELQCEIEKKEADILEEESSNIAIAKPIKISDCPSASLEELRERLHQKMAQLRGKRKMLEGQDKKDTREARLLKRTSKSKQKEKKELLANIKRVSDIGSTQSKAIVNDKGDVVFSRFDFATDTDVTKHEKKKKRDLNKLLAVAEKKESRISALKEKDLNAAQKTIAENQWINAVKKAQGEKIKDDPKLLKKTIKRKEKEKERSKKQWQDRVDNVEKQQAEKQKKRKEHIAERKAHKLSKKLGISKKMKSQKQISSKRTHKPGF